MKFPENEIWPLLLLAVGLFGVSWSIFKLFFIPYQELQRKRAGLGGNTPLKHFIAEEDLLRWQNVSCIFCVVLGLAVIVPCGNYLLIVPLGALAAVFYFAPKAYYGILIRKRNRDFEEGMLDFILMVSNGLRGGQSFASSVKVAAESAVDCVREEFLLALEEHNQGRDFNEALRRINGRIDAESLKLFTTVCLTSMATGGSLLPVLDNIIAIIRKKIAFRGRLPILVARTRFEAHFVSVFPIIVIFLIGVFKPDWVAPLFTEPLGQLSFACFLLTLAVGYYWMGKITDIKL